MDKDRKKTILLGVTGGIAAYKSAQLVRRLKKDGFDVLCVLTEGATKFVTPLTFEVLSGNPVATDTFERAKSWEVEHVSWAKRADLLVVAPATANFIGKYASGIADDMLTTTAMACRCPKLLAPAMNDAMYESAATQDNIALLSRRGVQFIGPGCGFLAEGIEAVGRMSEPDEIADEVLRILNPPQTLAGRHILVTAGPTREYLDPVRYITNRSSGKMGYALVEEALRRGARVSLITGPVSLSAPKGADVVTVESTKDLYQKCVELFPDCDAAIMAAAPADYTPKEPAAQKIKKANGQELSLQLVENPDIAATLGGMKKAQVLVTFSAETNDLLANARAKLLRKNADFSVANDVTKEGAGFDVDTNVVTLLDRETAEELPLLSKREVAARIIDKLEIYFAR